MGLVYCYCLNIYICMNSWNTTSPKLNRQETAAFYPLRLTTSQLSHCRPYPSYLLCALPVHYILKRRGYVRALRGLISDMKPRIFFGKYLLINFLAWYLHKVLGSCIWQMQFKVTWELRLPFKTFSASGKIWSLLSYRLNTKNLLIKKNRTKISKEGWGVIFSLGLLVKRNQDGLFPHF